VAHIGCQEVPRIERRGVGHMDTSRETARIAGCWDLIRSRDYQAAAGRRQPRDPHNLARKTTRELQAFRQLRKWRAGATYALNYPRTYVAAPTSSESLIETVSEVRN
jgi:hypothetical protein